MYNSERPEMNPSADRMDYQARRGNMKKRHIWMIDIVRFLAALSVMYYHIAYKAFANSDDTLNHMLPPSVIYTGANIGAFGWIGVQVFFVISGFVIAYSVQGETLMDYVRRRFLRLAPAVWIIVPLCAVIDVFAFNDPTREAFVHGLKTALFIPFGPWIIGQFWTLPIEIVFYSAVAMLIIVKQVDRLEPFGIILGLISAAYWFLEPLFHYQSHWQQPIRLLLLHHGIFFAVGIIIHRAAICGLTPLRLAFLALMSVAAFFQISWSAQWESTAFDSAMRSWVPFIIWFGSTVLLCVSVMRKPRMETPKKSYFAFFVRTLGLATYPLYLLHFHVGGIVLLSSLRFGFSVALSISVALTASIIASLLVAQFIEPQLKALILRLNIFSKNSIKIL